MKNQLKAMNRWLWMLVFTVSGFYAQATHIVGGSLTYKCLGNDTFELILTIYTDCLYGQAPYDITAWVGVFNDNGVLVDTIFMRLSNKIDTLDQDDPCFESVPNICVRVTQYKELIVLPLLPGGYYLAYQRCCRNGSIVNIVEPLESGATYWAYIPENTLKSCNNAPIWLKNPPIFVCVNEPLIFDHAAIDIDGDSLTYELITPYLGGIFGMNPQPTPPYGPKNGTYDTVIWNAPYSLYDLMGGVPLTIDPVTGLMVGMPGILGQFVIGVKVKEYRNGELIGETFRDFQYNVVPCKVTEAIIGLTDTTFCDEFFVQFTNNSTQASNYFWDFGVNGDTSTAFEPSYTFPDTGFYTITLIAGEGPFCSDTTSATIFIQNNSIEMCMDVRVPYCEDSIIVQLTDCSFDSVSPLISWDWTIITNDSTYHYNTPTTQIIFNETTQAIIMLTVESFNGCVKTLADTINFRVISPPDLVPDTVNLCYLEIANLNPNFDPSLQHIWSPDSFLLDPLNSPNPDILAFNTTLYTVTYTDSEGLCLVDRQVLLTVVDDLPPVELIVEIPQCIDTAIVFAYVDPFPSDVTVAWEVTTEQDVFIGGGAGIEVLITESQLVIVCAMIMTDSCSYIICDTVQVNILPDLILGDTLFMCQGDTVTLNPSGPPELVYQWAPPLYLDDPTKANPLASPPQSQQYTVTYTDTVGLCIINDSLFVQVNDSNKVIDFTWDVQCDGLMVEFINLSTDVDFFFWNFGDPNTSGDTSILLNPSYIYPGPGTYTVLLTSPLNDVCPHRDSIFKELVLEEAVNEADFTYDFNQCGFPTILQFFGTATSTYGVLDGWQWIFGNIGTSTEQNPIISITESMNLEVTLIVTWDSLCSDTVFKVIPIELYDLKLEDAITLCVDSCVQLNPLGEPGWVYTWSPASWVNDVNSPNPIVCPDSNGILTVEVILVQLSGDTCILRDTIQFTLDECDWECDDVVPEIMSCLDTVTLVIGECDPVFTLIWCAPNGDTLAIGPSVVIPMQLYEFVVLKKIGPFGYMEIDTIDLFFLSYTVPVSATADPVEIFQGGSSQLEAEAPTAVSYLWSPGETLSDIGVYDPTATPPMTTTYTVFVTDAFGCVGSDTVTVTVRTPICDFPYIFVPNTFTPNNDNLNDILFVRGSYIDVLEFYVYNRWGELVFETHDKNLGWDGTFKGELLRSDVYGYYLKCICYGQEEYFARGNVTLLRN